MDDYFNKNKDKSSNPSQQQTVDAKAINIDNYGERPKKVGMTTIQNRKEGI